MLEKLGVKFRNIDKDGRETDTCLLVKSPEGISLWSSCETAWLVHTLRISYMPTFQYPWKRLDLLISKSTVNNPNFCESRSFVCRICWSKVDCSQLALFHYLSLASQVPICWLCEPPHFSKLNPHWRSVYYHTYICTYIHIHIYTISTYPSTHHVHIHIHIHTYIYIYTYVCGEYLQNSCCSV